MASPAAVDITTQLGLESTPGTAVAANRFLPTISWMLKPRLGTQNFRARGSKVMTAKAQHKKWGEGSFEGVLDYNSICYILSGLFNNAAAVQQGTSGGYLRTYQPGVRTADTGRKTFTFEKGTASQAEKYAFGQLKSATIEATQDEAKVSGNLVAQYPTFNVTQTASPTSIGERPVQRGEIDVIVGSTLGELDSGGVAITSARQESLTIADKFREAWFHNSAKPSFTDVVELAYDCRYQFSMANDANCQTLLAAIASNPTKFIRWQAQGALIGVNGGSNVYELIQFNMAGKFAEPEPLEDDEGIYGYRFTFDLIDNATLGRHLEIKSINAIASL